MGQKIVAIFTLDFIIIFSLKYCILKAKSPEKSGLWRKELLVVFVRSLFYFSSTLSFKNTLPSSGIGTST